MKFPHELQSTYLNELKRRQGSVKTDIPLQHLTIGKVENILERMKCLSMTSDDDFNNCGGWIRSEQAPKEKGKAGV